jgi:hypothetical protein
LIKRYSAFGILTIALLYILAPYHFEKRLYFNEVLAFSGLILLAFKKFKIHRSTISVLVLVLICISTVHALISLFRADAVYYYLRNSVILYSMFTFFLGYYLYDYMVKFIRTNGLLVKAYVLVFLFFPVTNLMYDRFGVSVLFPAAVKGVSVKLILPLLVLLTMIYSINYESSSMVFLTLFYLVIYLCPGYTIFKTGVLIAFLGVAGLFVYLVPNLSIDPNLFSPHNTKAIWEVIHSHPILEIDPNTTWRLVIWKQLIVDLFPGNILGIGFGTPALKYFPIEDYSKLDTLPYVLGAHNSFVYLFSRLGIGFVVIILLLYRHIFMEYFYYKSYYKSNSTILIFFSFFAITIVALFNPVLETPIYASSYWLLLGFLTKVIDNRMKLRLSDG